MHIASLIWLFVALIVVVDKTARGGDFFVQQLMMSHCDWAGCEGWGHRHRLRRVAVWFLVWLAAAVIRPLCLQQGPTELPWQRPMFQTPPGSPDGLSDTEGGEGRAAERIAIKKERIRKMERKTRNEINRNDMNRIIKKVFGKEWSRKSRKEWGCAPGSL